jgi:molecular chaperone GrpE (heat shock protein)
MSRTTSSTRTAKSKPTAKVAKTSARTKTKSATAAKAKTTAKPKRVATKVTAAPKKSTAKAVAKKPTRAKTAAASPMAPVAEPNLAATVEKLSAQLGTALDTLAGLAAAPAQSGPAQLPATTTDRASATFQRLVAEAVDDRLNEMLPPLIGVRNEFARRANAADDADQGWYQHGLETLEHVFSLAQVSSYEVRVGEPYDPLIHLAVGSVERSNVPAGAVAELLQPGFRTARGKVLMPARVKLGGA